MCSQEKPSNPSRVLPLYIQEYYREFCRNAERRGWGEGVTCNGTTRLSPEYHGSRIDISSRVEGAGF